MTTRIKNNFINIQNKHFMVFKRLVSFDNPYTRNINGGNYYVYRNVTVDKIIININDILDISLEYNYLDEKDDGNINEYRYGIITFINNSTEKIILEQDLDELCNKLNKKIND